MHSEHAKIVRIPKAELPPLISSELGYIVRYRVISADKNRWSHWSNVFRVTGETISTVSGALQISSSTISAVWNNAPNNPNYDVFVGFDGSPVAFLSTTSAPTYSFLKTGVTSVRVVVQIESSTKTYNAALVIYDSGVTLL